MSGAKTDKINIYRMLKKHHRPLSARRLMLLAQEEFGLETNYGLFLSTLKKWAKQKQALSITDHDSSSEQLFELIEARHGVFKLQMINTPEVIQATSNESHGEFQIATGNDSDQQTDSSTTDPHQISLSPKIKRWLTAHDGKSSKKGELSLESLSEADRISGFLYPYPVTPVLISDIINAQKQLGEQFNQALWQHLQTESAHIAQTLSLKLKVPFIEHPSPIEPNSSPSITPQSESHHNLNMETDESLDTETDESLDTETDESLDTEADESLDTEADESLDTEADESLDTETDESLDTEADESLDTEADESYDDHIDHLDSQIRESLKDAETWLSMTQLLAQLDVKKLFFGLSESQQIQRLSAHLKTTNHQAQTLGQRPPYVFSFKGEVMCSAQSQTRELLQLETEIDQQLNDYHGELLNLLELKLQQMSLASFESLLITYLERDQYTQLEALNRRSDGRLALLAQHPTGTTLVIAQQSKKALTMQQLEQVSRNLKSMYIESCLVIHLGGFEVNSPNLKNFTLINANQFAKLLIEKSIGVRQYTTSRAFIDEAWFDDHDN